MIVPAADIIEQVARFRRVSVTMLRSHTRARRFAWARQEACYFLRGRTELSLPAIGTFVGHRDHSTVLYAVKAVEQRMANIPGYGQQIENIGRLIDTCTSIDDGVIDEASIHRARRVLNTPENSTTLDAVCLATTILGALAALTSDQLTDREARLAARHTLCGSGRIIHE